MADDLTVIVVVLLGGEALDRCLQAVRPRCAEVLVVRRDGTIIDADGRTAGVADRLDIPAKRRSAVELATTPLVALLEDIVVPDPGWVDAVTATLSHKGVVACGGPVRMADGLPAQTQALILSEYGRYNERAPPGKVDALPGCNFAFRREALREAMRGSEGLVDLPVFGRLNAMGKLVCAPAMAVTFAHAWPEAARLKTRFDHGRIYGGGQAGVLRRTATAAKAVLLPPMLTIRTLRSGGRVAPSILAALMLQHSAWAAGEFVGAVFGSGKGLDGWR